MKIAVLGSGNMGGAIVRGLLAKRVCFAGEIVCTAKSVETLSALAVNFPGLGVSCDNAAAAEGADLILLCVKPWLLEKIIEEIRGHVSGNTIVASVAAGISLEQLETFFGNSGTRTLFRVMPNTAAACGESMTFFAAKNASEPQIEYVQTILNALGKTAFIEEKQMAAATALASCGIAFAMRYIRAACEGGVELGFYPEASREFVLQTLRGAVELLEESGEHPEAAIDRVTTPGGITIRGLNAMEAAGFTPAVIAGLKASAL
ncbi:MAG: pyrroline-5-carboxylate reductase [Verrucomicrobia bacterium]|nr:pyrroline-5-carboxylate reductase [Verrucomicrobiota bacterium]